MDPDMLKKIIEIFNVELDERIQEITDSLLAIESAPDDPENNNRLQSIFRAAHNIKGSARSIGIENIGVIAHRLEDLFSKLQDQGIKPSQEICTICFEALDAMQLAMQAYLEEKELGIDLNDLLEVFDCAVKDKVISNNSKDQPEVTISTCSQVDKKHKESQNINQTKSQDKQKNAKKHSKTEKEKKFGVIKKSNDISVSSDSIRISKEKINGLSSISDELLIQKIKNDDLASQMIVIQDYIKNISKMFTSVMDYISPDVNNINSKEISSIRSTFLNESNSINDSVKDFINNIRTVNIELGLTISALQENLRVMRLVPVGVLLQPMLRGIRDIAQELNKQIDVEIIGKEIEIDRAILEHLKSPLIHIIRNAIDHGIESPEIREAANKPAKGKIIIKADEKGGEVFISVIDDGGGIDLDQIRNKAVDLNICSVDDKNKLTKNNLLELIVRPGFSTKKIITDVSGRGVGMDVVQTNINEVKGSLHIDTEEKKGTSITMCLPLTLVSDRGIIVKINKQIFIIPTISIKKILRLSLEDLDSIEGVQCIHFDDQSIPLCYLDRLLGINTNKDIVSEGTVVLVLQKSLTKIAFIVDEILGEREIVIKPLLPPLTKAKYISGATFSGRGEVLLVLCPDDLIESALQESSSKLLAKTNSVEKNIPSILVVDDSISTRTLEESILRSNGYQVKTAVNGLEAWKRIQQESFDLIVTDIEMPNMDGFELTDKIKSDAKHKDVPVVIVTSCAKNEDKQKGVEVGADAYITKGQFETKALLDVVAQLL